MPTQLGTLHQAADGRSQLRFERALRHPQDKVWRAISQPAELKHWFPMSVELASFTIGGHITFRDANLPGPLEGTITELDPPRVLAYTWGPDVLRFELQPADDGCRLVFTHTFDDDGIKAARDGAGWHVCLEQLQATLDGTPVNGQPDERWAQLHPSYVAALGGRTMSHAEAVETGRAEYERHGRSSRPFGRLT